MQLIGRNTYIYIVNIVCTILQDLLLLVRSNKIVNDLLMGYLVTLSEQRGKRNHSRSKEALDFDFQFEYKVYSFIIYNNVVICSYVNSIYDTLQTLELWQIFRLHEQSLVTFILMFMVVFKGPISLLHISGFHFHTAWKIFCSTSLYCSTVFENRYTFC